MRKASIICSILLSLFFLTEPVNAQSINLTPKWTAQAQFAGYYVADKLGFYKEEGLDVHVVHPSLSASFFFLFCRRVFASGSYEPIVCLD